MIKPNDKAKPSTSGTYASIKETLAHSEASLDRCIDEGRQRVAAARARKNAEETQPIPHKVR